MALSFFRPRLRAGLARTAAVLLLAGLSGCGFALRGATPIPVDTLYLGVPDNTRFGADLRRAIAATSPETRLVDTQQEAQASFLQVSESRTEREVSLDPNGRVEEYELSIRYVFRVVDARGQLVLADTTLTGTRDMPYDDQARLAKSEEAERLFEDIQRSLISRIIRRLTAPDVSEALQATLAAGDDDIVRPLAPPIPQEAPPSLPRPDLGSRPNPDF